MAKKKQSLKKQISRFYDTRFILIGCIILVILFFMRDLTKGVLLSAVFVPLAVFTTRWGKLLPNVSPETITASAIFMGICFGAKIGFLFGLIVGLYAYMKNSCINLTFFTLTVLAALSGAFADYLFSHGFDFYWTFGLSILMRNAVGLPLFMFFVFPNPPENIMQHSFHLFLNVLIYMPLFSVLFTAVELF